MKRINFNLNAFLTIIITLGFLAWGGLFIYQSSFITIDRQRSYSLFDDAMISMRYAWNFSHGQGLVWNSGEYVQGYTNLLMVLIMSVVTLFLSKTTSVLMIQVLGVFFMLLIAGVNAKIASIIFSNDNNAHKEVFVVLAFLCGLVYYPLAYWSLMGMETGLLSVLLLSGVFFALGYTREARPVFLLLFSIVGGLAFLTRNDSFIFFFILWVYLYVENFRTRSSKNELQWYLVSIGLYFIFIVGELWFQYIYYGQFLPNTYVLKMTGMPLTLRIQNGLGFIWPYLKEIIVILTFSVIALLLRFDKRKILLFSLFVVSVVYQVYVGGDPWNYWRIMSPAMPLLLLLAVDGVFVMGKYVVKFSGLQKNGFNLVVSLALLVACVSMINLRFWPEIFFHSKPFQVNANYRNANIAVALNDILDPSATVGVFWAGTIPYYVDSKAIDFLGKSDLYIANLPPDLSGSVSFNGMTSVPGHNKYDLQYSIVKLKPTYVQKFFWGNQNVDSMVEDDYVVVKYRYMTLYLLKDSPDVNWKRLDLP